MSSHPRVSVVIAVHDGGSYLREALESILTQTLADWETVVVDDGSTDETPDLLDEYASQDQRFVVIHQPNAGQTRALNTGLAASGGEYIARLDADDLMLGERLEQQVEFLSSHPEVAIVGTGAELIDDQGRPYCILQPPASDVELRLVMIQRNPFVHSSVMFRREVLRVVGGYDDNVLIAQDYDLWIRTAQHFALANLPQPLTRLRRFRGNISYNHYRRQAWETLLTQARAIQRGWYPLWNLTHIWRPLVYLIMPTPLFRLAMKKRQRRHKRVMAIRL